MEQNRQNGIVATRPMTSNLKFIFIVIYSLLYSLSIDSTRAENTSSVGTVKQIGNWNFDDRNTKEWKILNKNKHEVPLPVAKTPIKSNLFLGKLSNNTAKLSLINLQQHDSITLSFDIYIIGTWDGNNRTYGPDVFSLWIDSVECIRTTFSNTTFLQTYPDKSITHKEYPAKTGAKFINTLGFRWQESKRYDGIMDAVYTIKLTVPHHKKSATLLFSCSLYDNDTSLFNESWGLDNVTLYSKNVCANSIDYHFQSDSILHENEPVIIFVNTLCDTCIWSNGFVGNVIIIKEEGTYICSCISTHNCKVLSKEFTIQRKKRNFPIKGK